MAEARKTFDALGHMQASRAGRRDPRALPRLIRASVGLARQASPRLFATLSAFQLLNALLLAAQIVLAKLVIDAILGDPGSEVDFASVTGPIVALAVAAAASGFVAAAVTQVQRTLGERVTQLTWRSVLDVTTSVELERFEDPAFFDDVQRVKVNAVMQPLTMANGVGAVLNGALSVVALLIVLLVLAPLLVPVLVLSALPLWLVSRRTGRLEFAFVSATTPLVRERTYLELVLTGRDEAQEMRAYDLGGPLRERWSAHAQRYLRALDEHAVARLKLACSSAGVSALATGITLGLLVWLVAQDRLALSSAAVSLFAVRFLAARVQALFGGITQLFESSLFMQDLQRFLARAPARTAPEERADAARLEQLELAGVGFTYPGSDRPALRDVDLVLRRGETIALVGSNGSGKTTLAKLIAQLFDADAGQLRWNGTDVTTLDRESLRAAVGVIFQDYLRYQLTAADNIGLGRIEALADRARMERAARRGGAHALIAALPDGYDTRLGKEFSGGYDLSGGQWQRIALARAFFRDAELLVLDEPTAALDAQAEHEIFEQVRDLAEGRTLLLISHRFSTVKSADRIYVLDDGAILEQGSHEELMAAGGRYAELFELQARAYR